MSTAICIPFFRYPPHEAEQYYRVYFENLLKTLPLWKDEFDTLYLIDQDMNFTDDDIKRLRDIKPSTHIIMSVEQGHHWVQFRNAVPKIVEDTILFMDSDVLIWEKGIIKGWFDKAKNTDVVTAFDGSGGMVDIIQKRFPLLKKLNAVRMGSYYFILHKKIFDFIPLEYLVTRNYPVGTYIEELDYTTTEEDWFDTFGMFTIKLLARNPVIELIYDERASLCLSDKIVKFGEPKTSGYYHVRNGNMATYVLASKIGHREDYDRMLRVTPIHELTRELAWFWILADYHKEVLGVVADLGISESLWNTYVDEFRKFHHYPIL